jgi:hypothetical protein
LALRACVVKISSVHHRSVKGHAFYRACAKIVGEFIQISPVQKLHKYKEIRRVDRTTASVDGAAVDKSEWQENPTAANIHYSTDPDKNHEGAAP